MNDEFVTTSVGELLEIIKRPLEFGGKEYNLAEVYEDIRVNKCYEINLNFRLLIDCVLIDSIISYAANKNAIYLWKRVFDRGPIVKNVNDLITWSISMMTETRLPVSYIVHVNKFSNPDTKYPYSKVEKLDDKKHTKKK